MNVSQITNTVNSFFQKIDSMITKVVPMPAILLLCACVSRPGLSKLRSLTNVCKSLEALGISTQKNPDGSQNLVVAVSNVLLTEIYRAMAEDAVVQGGVESGKVSILAQGSNSAGPIICRGSNLLPFHLWGLIS